MYLGIILTLVAGLFFLIGIIILKNIKNKASLSVFTIAMAFIVLLGLILEHLLPEVMSYKNWYLLIPIVIGFLSFTIIDKLIPHHHHEHSDEKCDEVDHNRHLEHIGLITIVALALHNIIEGITLYNVSSNDIKSGLLLMISVSLHNIPFGFQIGNLLDIKKNKLLIAFLCLSSSIGALIMIAFGELNVLFESILLSLTFGMLLYIMLFEFLQEVIKGIRKKETIIGLIIGLIIIFITHII